MPSPGSDEDFPHTSVALLKSIVVTQEAQQWESPVGFLPHDVQETEMNSCKLEDQMADFTSCELGGAALVLVLHQRSKGEVRNPDPPHEEIQLSGDGD